GLDPVGARPRLRAFADAESDRAGKNGRLDRPARARHQQPRAGLRICEVALVQRVHFTDTELDDFLNRMLEAERAGAKALVVFLDDWPRHGAEWQMLRK